MSEASSRRKRTYDAEGSRSAILSAAEVVFAEHGFEGARVDSIAAEAGCNKSLIFQYFGDKLNLYMQVLKRVDDEANTLRAQVFAPLLMNGDLATDAQQLRTFFEAAFHAVFNHLLDHPRLLRILLWEMAEGWRTSIHIHTHVQIEHVEQLELLFQKAQHAGLIRSTFSPIIQLTMALQTCQSYLACLPLYQALLPHEDLSSAAALAHARQHIVAAIVAGIMFDRPPHSEQ
jgi:AcrR family transcriptional regulator